MALISADLRAACPLSKDTEFLGMQRMLGTVEADNLDFGTHNYTPRKPREGDFCQESIYVNEDPQTKRCSLWRRSNPTLAFDPLSGGRKEEIARDIIGLRFEYYDGVDWYDTWGETKSGKRETTQKTQPNLSGLPNAVRVTLLMDSNPKSRASADTGERVIEPPLAFQTVVQLNLADSSQPGFHLGRAVVVRGAFGADCRRRAAHRHDGFESHQKLRRQNSGALFGTGRH
jgi:hypothetical protein